MADTQTMVTQNWRQNGNSTTTPYYHETYTTWDETDLAKRLSLGHAGFCAFGIVLNLFGIIVLVRLLRQKIKVSPVYYLFLAVAIADLLALAVWLLYLLVAYAGPGTPLAYNTLTDSHSNFNHLLIYIWNFPVELLWTASDWMILAAALLCVLHMVRKPTRGSAIMELLSQPVNGQLSKICNHEFVSRGIIIMISKQQVGLGMLMSVVYSLVFNMPFWSNVKISIDDGKLRESFVYKIGQYQDYGYIATIYIPYGLGVVMIITLSVLSETLRAEKELRKVLFMLIAVLAWMTVMLIPLLTYLVSYENPIIRIKFNRLILHSASRYTTILKYAAKVIFYCCFNSTFRRMAVSNLLCRRHVKMEDEVPLAVQSDRTGEASTDSV